MQRRSAKLVISALCAVVAAATSGAQATRAVRGVVTDTAEHPVSLVRVEVRDGSSTVTDDSGRFRFEVRRDLPVTFELKRIGFLPSRIRLSSGGDTSITLTIYPSVQELAGVAVNAPENVASSLSGFDARMREKYHGGYFVTARDIEQRNPTRTTQLFEGVPGIQVKRVGQNNATRYSIFGMARTIRDASSMGVCEATVYLDGVRVMAGGNLVLDPQGRPLKTKDGRDLLEPGVPIDDVVGSPSNIIGIEVYPSANRAPEKYQQLNGNCAVVLIWTRTRGR